MSEKLTLGSRMKTFYEDRYRFELMRRTYTIIRIDGKAFHTFTKRFQRPYDTKFMELMDDTAKYLCSKIMGAKFAYVQSDEISIVITDFDTHQTQAWFEYNLQKMASVAASMATAKFNKQYFNRLLDDLLMEGKSGADIMLTMATTTPAEFDARVFQVPNRIECFNAILWRQQDATRNSIQSVAQSLYPHKELQGKNGNELQELIFKKGINWNDYRPYFKRGRIIKKESEVTNGPIVTEVRSKWVVDEDIPIFSQEKEYLYTLIPEEEVYEPETDEVPEWVRIKNQPNEES